MIRHAIFLLAGAAVLFAQTPEFENAAIRLNTSWPVMGIGLSLKGTLFTGQAIFLRNLISYAYGVSADRVSGPDFLDRDRYDIAARLPTGGELKPMLQSMLRDRFRLSVHTETRIKSFYELVIAPGGVKITRNIADQPRPKYKKASGTTLIAQRITMDRLAEIVAREGGHPVVDKTGLTGTFAIAFQTSASLSTEGSSSDPGDEAPDVFRAVQEQLGLKLVPVKGDLDVFVVDHMERTPTEN